MKGWYERVQIGGNWESMTAPFVLENGLEQLEPYFSEVKLSRYDDNLQVTDVELLMAYIRSMIRAGELSKPEFASLRQDLEKEVHEKGQIFISKDSGLFEAVK
jgi:hypothetical protein